MGSVSDSAQHLWYFGSKIRHIYWWIVSPESRISGTVISHKLYSATFTAKFHYVQSSHFCRILFCYLQLPIFANSETRDLQPNSITCKFMQPVTYYTE